MTLRNNPAITVSASKFRRAPSAKIGEQTRRERAWFHAFLWNFAEAQAESRVKE
jgi:hypothetical protein